MKLATKAEGDYNTVMQHIRIGTRGSELALAQARLAVQALQSAHPGLECELVIISTAGDQRTDIPLNQVNAATGTGDKGVFIATIEEALARGEIDCAVHSLKDMPGVLDARFSLAAVLPREEIQDVLVVKPGADWKHLTIATGSVRRAHMVKSFFGPDTQTIPVRGNVATRLRKLVENPAADATLLARAGLNRLGYARDFITVQGTVLAVESLPVSEFYPALGQGAVALETRKDDPVFESMVAAVNDAATSRCIRCERHFLHLLQADCSVPVGGYATAEPDGAISLHVCYYDAKRGQLKVCARSTESPEAAAEEAHRMLLQQLGA